MSRKQKRLLFSAIQCTRPGGEIVYSTCTFAPEENEAVIDALLRRFAGLVTVEPLGLSIPGIEPGLTRWRRDRYDNAVRHAARVLPDDAMEGFFICRLRKHSGTVAGLTEPEVRRAERPRRGGRGRRDEA